MSKTASKRKSRTRKRSSQKTTPRRQPFYHVILWDDDDHTYGYVIRMFHRIFGYPAEKGYELAREVDTIGRVICMTTTKELAELKRDQIHAFGPDEAIGCCKGSMSATITPALAD